MDLPWRKIEDLRCLIHQQPCKERLSFRPLNDEEFVAVAKWWDIHCGRGKRERKFPLLVPRTRQKEASKLQLRENVPRFKVATFLKENRIVVNGCQMSNEKNLLLSMKYWLFRDPYNGLLQSPHNWVVVQSHIYSKTTRGLFFSLLKYETSVLTMAWTPPQLMVGIPPGPSSDFLSCDGRAPSCPWKNDGGSKKKHQHVVWEKTTECSAIWTTSPARRASLYINLYHLGPWFVTPQKKLDQFVGVFNYPFPSTMETQVHMGVSRNRGTPKSWILIGFSIINHPFWGTPIFGNTHIVSYRHSQLHLLIDIRHLLPALEVDGRSLRWESELQKSFQCLGRSFPLSVPEFLNLPFIISSFYMGHKNNHILPTKKQCTH